MIPERTKPIQVYESDWRKLMDRKISGGKKSIADVVSELLKGVKK